MLGDREPCPPGYHVPVHAEYQALLNIGSGVWGGNGVTVDGRLFFPAIAYRYVSLSASEAKLEIGDILLLTATLTPSNASDSGDIEWVSSNPEIASVSKDGKVTALARGEAVITATLFGCSASCTVTVTPKGGGYPGDLEPFEPDPWK